MVVDCGHGGGDPGATGIFGIKEKDINLKIGRLLTSLLRTKGFNVIMTRAKDTSISIEDRISKVNQYNDVDLFISIHANSSSNPRALGIETFCLQKSLFYPLKTYEGKSILDKIRGLKYKQSKELANILQSCVISHARKFDNQVVDRGIKFAVSRMLLGVNFPGALLEVGFLTNQKEAELLSHYPYQKAIAEGVCNGIVEYFKNIKKVY